MHDHGEAPRLSQRRERLDDTPSSPLDRPTIGEVIGARHGRREVLRGALGVSAIALLAGPVLAADRAAAGEGGTFAFEELAAGVDETHHVAPGHRAEVLIRWGDAVVPGAPAFDPHNQSARVQERQFGYNNDYVAFLPLPPGSSRSDRGLLCVNHEYTNETLMFPGHDGATPERIEIAMAAHGHSVVEIVRHADGRWRTRPDSPYNRRISPRSTEILLSGPAAGHRRVRTTADPSGARVLGTLNNCAGGVTPYGTVLIAEENFQEYFTGEIPDGNVEARNHARYGVPEDVYGWGRTHDRFRVDVEPREPNRFGWIVEIDPYDSAATPVKRTALGRFKHEGAECIENPDGRLVVVMGDDQRFDYVYKFVSHGRVDRNDRGANFGLLDSGTLYVARFDAGGTVHWLPLVFGTGPLTPENDFESQADVLIETRRAADLLGATPMDRPEDVVPDPAAGTIYVMLTSNVKRKPDATHPANPRAGNSAGHILEISVRGGDFANLTDEWRVLALAGDPQGGQATQWGPETSEHGWFRNPDNGFVDARGRLWIATDGNSADTSGRADGIWAMETEGAARGSAKHFFRCPLGAEMCGPFMTPDDTTFFVAVQHPGDVDGSSFERPATRWPDFAADTPMRPAVVAITRPDGAPVA